MYIQRYSQRLYDDDMEEKLDQLPKCTCCKEPIQDEMCIYIDDNQILCEECELYNAKDLWMEYGRQDYLRKVEDIDV